MYQFFHTAAPAPPRAQSPTAKESIDSALSAYLAGRLGPGAAAFAEPPALVPAGWEAYVYRFRLAGVPAPFGRPLVLRLYAGPRGRPRACREFAAQDHAYRHGYPVPRPLLLEEDSTPLGGPFIVMEHVAGETLLERLRGNWARVLAVSAHLARAHARLHALPAAGLKAPAGPFLARQLDEMRRTARAYNLGGLAEGLRWLDARRPPAVPPRLLHLDFHPVNLILRDDGECAVLDWSEADVGDPHADVAMTLLLLRYAPVEGLATHERLAAPVSRWALARRYRIVYRRAAPLDRDRLRYYLAWACLRRLTTYGMWLRAGPLSNGSKPAAVRRVTPGHVRELRGLFAELTGIAPDVGCSNPSRLQTTSRWP